MKLVVNSDDFGISRGMNYAVVDAYKYGTLSSTTALVCSKEIDHAVQLANENPGLGVGLHLSFDFFNSLSKNSELSDEDGFLLTRKSAPLKRVVSVEAIIEEWELQLALFKKLFNRMPTHLDSHHHAHLENEYCTQAVKFLAQKYDLPVRGCDFNGTVCRYDGTFYDETVSLETLEQAVLSLKEYDDEQTILEICLHNAYIDKELVNATTYNIKRMDEHEILVSKEFKQFLEKNDVQLVNY